MHRIHKCGHTDERRHTHHNGNHRSAVLNPGAAQILVSHLASHPEKPGNETGTPQFPASNLNGGIGPDGADGRHFRRPLRRLPRGEKDGDRRQHCGEAHRAPGNAEYQGKLQCLLHQSADTSHQNHGGQDPAENPQRDTRQPQEHRFIIDNLPLLLRGGSH